MLIVLPPSEGKTPPAAGRRPVDPATLSWPALTAPRLELVARLERLVAGPRPAALRALGLSAGQADELECDADLLHAPAAPAGRVYTGVLYQHLALPELSPRGRRRARTQIAVASALWGMLGVGDAIPAYRLSMGARLPGLPGLAAWWRPALAAALPDPGLLVDLRSSTYAAAWRPGGAQVVEVGARTPAGAVISHMAKATRGEVARLLLEAPVVPRNVEDVASCVEAAGRRAELRPGRRAGSWSLDVVAAA